MTEFVALIEQAQSSDPALRRMAFDQIVPRFQKMAFAQAYHILRDQHLAEDVVQDAFLTAYKHIDQLQSASAFPAWFRRIVRTQCDRLIRSKQYQLEPLEVRYDLATEKPGPEALLEEAELQDRVQFAIDSLPEHERTVTEGFYIQGQSQKELADRLEVPLTTVKKRLQYAREHLRLVIGDLNAAVDEAIARVLKPHPEPKRQPVYIYARRQPSGHEDDAL